MPLSIVLTLISLVLAVPVGLLLFLLWFRAIGPWRSARSSLRLPDLPDEPAWRGSMALTLAE